MNEQQNTKLVQDAYAAFKRGDISGLLNMMSEDVGWFLPGPAETIPFVGQRRGRDQVRQFFTSLAELQEPEQFEPREFIAQGGKVAVQGQYRWRVKSTGRSFGSEFMHVFTVHNGKITDFREYFDTHLGVLAYSGSKAAGS